MGLLGGALLRRSGECGVFVWRMSTRGALARLGLARAYSLQGDIRKAKAAYQDLFALWKDADTEIPVLKQAKMEYAKLQ